MAALLSLSEYKVMKGITTTGFDAQISALIDVASDYARAYCNRDFDLAEYTEQKKGVVDYLGRFMFFMKELPVVSVSSITLQFIGSSETTSISPDDITLISNAGYAYYLRGVGDNSALISPSNSEEFYYTIVYSGGKSNIPGPVKLAVTDMVHNTTEYLNRTNSVVASGVAVTGELRAVKIGDYEERYTRQSLFPQMVKDHGVVLSQTALDLLAPYKKMGQGVS